MTLRLKNLNDDGSYTVSACRTPGDPEHVVPAPLQELAAEAARLLKEGYTVRWEPGDATRYVLSSFRAEGYQWLAFLNFSGLLKLRDTYGDHGTSVGDYCWSSAPTGGWKGLRPLIEAMGCAQPRPRLLTDSLLDLDARDEERYRRDFPKTTPPRDRDAELGREVRALVEKSR